MNTSALAQYQASMGLHLRDPDTVSPPAHLDERRLSVYRDLVFNNIESQLSSAFPVIQNILSDEQWMLLVREFLRDYRAQTPYFTRLSAEFVTFLANRESDDNTPAFLLELAHYERVELDIYMQDEKHAHVTLSEHEILTTPLGIASTTQLLAYAYPVHQIRSGFRLESAPDTPTLLLLFQDEEQEVRFFELQALAYRLVARIAEDAGLSGLALLKELAIEMNLPFTATFQQQGKQLLQQLNALKVLRSR